LNKEAEGIRPFVANSPLMSWVYGPMSVRGFSAVLGVVEVGIAMLIAARPFSLRASVLGSALAVGMFLTTAKGAGPMTIAPERVREIFTGLENGDGATFFEHVAVQKAPTVPGCVWTDWQVMEHDWDTPPAKSASSDMTMDPVLLPPEDWIG
jgi:hypothetical protein